MTKSKAIRKYTVDLEGCTKYATIFLQPDGSYTAVAWVEGVDTAPGANWESDDLYEIVDNVKHWL